MDSQNLAEVRADDETLARARDLVVALEAGKEDEARLILDDLARLREGQLFQELGKLTRELHETLKNFHLDARLSDLAEQEIPDAKERLNHVIDMTEQAAHRTLNAVEEALPLAEGLEEESGAIRAEWERFRRKEMSADQFRAFSRRLDQFLPRVEEEVRQLHRHISDVLMAQDFQDLTGQIIRRVITLVQDVEQSLVDLIRLSGGRSPQEQEKGAGEGEEKEKRNIVAEGPQVLASEAENTVSSQDEVDDLLSSLGF
ncbi:MAG TPA: protein phosphatase CheZ [Thiotrichales bacterium]|nr:protein phosphatase CheZ [Thiotrichales bacterium]